MSIRFYRRVSLGKGAALNIGKTGVSLSLGIRGAHMTFGGVGGVRATVGIPGTGLFWTYNFTAAAKRKARYEAKQQRDAAYESEKQHRALERERKKQEREKALERAILEKQIKLASLKSEFDEYNAYVDALSNFHRIDMICGEQAQEAFVKRSEHRAYTQERFPLDDLAESISVYSYQNNLESDSVCKPIEDILCTNNEQFRKKTNHLAKLRNIAKLKNEVGNCEDKLNIPAIALCLGFVLILGREVELGLVIMFFSLVAAKAIDIIYGIIKTKQNIKLQMKELDIDIKKFDKYVQSIDSFINKELNFYEDRKKDLVLPKSSFLKILRSQWITEDSKEFSFAEDRFKEFLVPQEDDKWEVYEKKQEVARIIKMRGQGFYNWAVFEVAGFIRKKSDDIFDHVDFILTLPEIQKIEINDDSKRLVFFKESVGFALLELFDDLDKIQQEYEDAIELREKFEIWLNQGQHKSDWLENETKRVELLRKAGANDREAISALCEALLPLSLDITPPSWIDASSLQEYEIAYYVETHEEAWLLIELPDLAIIPEYSAQLSSSGSSLTYPAITERNRFALYDKFAASFSLLHAQLLYLTFPFFKKIWIESYTKAIDPATGMLKRKDIVQGYIDTENFKMFNFNNASPVEAVKALKLSFFPRSTKHFVEPSWADDDERIIWASREDEVPDGLFPF